MPRAGLSRQVVVEEAGRVADEAGLDRLTLAAVAGRLNVKLPSLYKHVEGLDALRTDLATVGARELAAGLSAATVGRAGGDALLSLARAYRDYARRRPGVYTATLRAPEPTDAEHHAAGEAVLQVVYAVLAGFGLRDDDAIDAVRGLRAIMHGFVAIEAAGGYKLPQDLDRSYERLVTTYAETLRTWAGAA